jgi:hypothetical protein
MDRGNQLTLESLGPPELDVLLRPGDMLYIPHGVVHVAHTLGREKCERWNEWLGVHVASRSIEPNRVGSRVGLASLPHRAGSFWFDLLANYNVRSTVHSDLNTFPKYILLRRL